MQALHANLHAQRAVSLAAIALALASSGCTRQSVEIEVRDPGRVQVGVRSSGQALPVLLPDGQRVRVPVPVAAGQPQASVSRDGRTIVIAWANDAGSVNLVDEQGLFPAVSAASGIKVTGPFLYADYDVTDRRAFEPGKAPAGSVPMQLSTPLDNVRRAAHVSERRPWPAYVMLPLGGLLTVAGAVLMTVSDDDLGRVAGGFYLAGGLPLIGYGVYWLVDEPSVTPLAAGAPATTHAR